MQKIVISSIQLLNMVVQTQITVSILYIFDREWVK